MKIWIDLANSPQVLFFRPILSELERQGHSLDLTTRAYAQTVQLAGRLGLQHTVIGRHGGCRLAGLAGQICLRAFALARWARRRGFDLAVSHNSYSQATASRLLGVPVVTLMDYEHQPLNHLCFRLARRVIVPECFPQELLRRYGAARKTISYAGVKEQIYLAGFKPQPDFRQSEGLPVEDPLVVIRPPAPWTAYHRFENDLFDQLLGRLSRENQGCLLFLPRLPGQAESVRGLPGLRVAERVYDGPNLLYHADLVISGGGTMNREAAVLGTPTCTVFKGKLGAVDRCLIAQGRMTHLETRQDIEKVRVVCCLDRKPALEGSTLVASIVDRILFQEGGRQEYAHRGIRPHRP